ncbi:hypothetical protein NDU88_001297 [Pleurodeles waltl]|uniref:Uncharacterized protein n=1 Tax=Pleurodeles waltl TaxID=8319 RepID=A0AAV7R9B9_PLEWA|nr:hypothetical protein NDU88_001297 [Pleurodeles waltl]
MERCIWLPVCRAVWDVSRGGALGRPGIERCPCLEADAPRLARCTDMKAHPRTHEADKRALRAWRRMERCIWVPVCRAVWDVSRGGALGRPGIEHCPCLEADAPDLARCTDMEAHPEDT